MAKWLWQTGRSARLFGVDNAIVHYTGSTGAPRCGARSDRSSSNPDEFLVLVTDKPSDVTCSKCERTVRLRPVGRKPI